MIANDTHQIYFDKDERRLYYIKSVTGLLLISWLDHISYDLIIIRTIPEILISFKVCHKKSLYQFRTL